MSGDEVVVDLTGYRDRVGSQVEPGRYAVVVEDAELDKSKQNNQMINLWLRIEGGTYDGSTIIDRLVLTEKSLFRVVGFMQALGLQTPKKRIKINIAQFKGRRLEVDVDDGEPYMGRVKSEVRGYIRIPGGAAAAEAAGDLSDVEDVQEIGTEDVATISAEDLPPARSTEEVLAGVDAAQPMTSTSDEVDLDAIDLG